MQDQHFLASLAVALSHTLTANDVLPSSISLPSHPAHSSRQSSKTKRASVCAILRMHGLRRSDDASSSSANASSVPSHQKAIGLLLDGLQFDFLELLFIKRANNPKDRWSGHIAFPGGRQEKGETDQETAEREAFEEIGLDLSQESDYLLLGKLSDKVLPAGLTVCTFVYLQICPSTPPLNLCTKEVSSAFWIPIQHLLSSAPLHYVRMDMRLQYDLLKKYLHDAFAAYLSIDRVRFPALLLNRNDEKGKETNIVTDLKDIAGPIPHHILWGMTLGRVRELMSIAGAKLNNDSHFDSMYYFDNPFVHKVAPIISVLGKVVKQAGGGLGLAALLPALLLFLHWIYSRLSKTDFSSTEFRSSL